jgi:hypothetical protein
MISVTRTNRQFGISSSEYRIIFPNGDEMTIWSPPWHEMSSAEEDAEAKRQAERIWQQHEDNP